MPPRPLRGVPARATESVNCRPAAVILVYSHHPQPPTLTTPSTKPMTLLKIIWGRVICLKFAE